MLSFGHPWLALLLPLPFLVHYFVPAHVERRDSLRVPFLDRLASLTGQQPREGATIRHRDVARLVLLTATWLLVVTALMRPQWIEPPLHQYKPTRDLLLLVDLSGSMDTKDFIDAKGRTVDRLTAVKEVLDDFLTRRRGDRVGVVVFGDAPFVLVPFTTDLSLCRTLLQEMVVGMAGPRTAFGDAIGLAIGLFGSSTVKSKTIIALTDGNDTASKIPPREAAGIAKDKGIVIHTVAIGDPTAAGEEKLDEAALQDVATASGGIFSRALDRAQLTSIYTHLDAIETHKIDTVSFRPKRDIYWIPLGAALVITLLAQAIRLAARLPARHRAAAAAEEASL